MRASVLAAVVAIVISLGAPPASAERGTAELHLDRAAVRTLIGAALPEPRALELPGIGHATLRLGAPSAVEFSGGGIDLVLPLTWVEGDLGTSLAVRLVPSVEPLSGTIRLRAESVTPRTPLPWDADLAGWIAPLELPRVVEGALGLRWYLQGLKVGADRLVLELGLAGATPTRRAWAARSP